MTQTQLIALEKLVALNAKKLELYALIAWFEDTKQSPYIVTPLGNPPILLKAIVKEIELHMAAVRGAMLSDPACPGPSMRHLEEDTGMSGAAHHWEKDNIERGMGG